MIPWAIGWEVFPHVLGECTVEEAETWALLHGLRMAWDLGA